MSTEGYFSFSVAADSVAKRPLSDSQDTQPQFSLELTSSEMSQGQRNSHTNEPTHTSTTFSFAPSCHPSPAIASPFHPPISPLNFDPSRIAASPRTIQLANRWPNDTSMQQLLQTIMDMAAKHSKEGYFLTSPAAIVLAGCAVKMASYLTSTATSLLDINQDVKSLREISSCTRESTLHMYGTHGWDAVSSIPKSVVQRWWQMARERQIQPLPAENQNQMNSETEEVVCGAIVSEWLRTILNGMRTKAIELQTSFLSLIELQSIVNPHRVTIRDALHERVADICLRLDCMTLVDLDNISMDPFQLKNVEPRMNSFASEGYADFYAEFLGAEEQAMWRILNADSWYYQSSVLRKVAQQFGNGERRLHVVDTMQHDFGMKLLNMEAFPCVSGCHYDEDELVVKYATTTIHALIIDASGNEFSLSFDHRRDTNYVTLLYEGAVIAQTFPGCLPRQLHNWLTLEKKAASARHRYISERFQPHLSPQQKQLWHHMKESAKMLDTYWKENNNEIPIKLARVQPPKDAQLPAAGLGLTPTISFGSFGTFGSFASDLQTTSHQIDVINVDRLMWEWRANAFEQMLLQVQPLFDLKTWGVSFLQELHTVEVRRRFQSHLIDAVMDSNGMQLLPTVLLDIVADFYTIESLPFVAPDDQAFVEAGLLQMRQ